MKALLLAVASVLFVGQSALADHADQRTIFDQLQGLFQTGTQPEAADLVGWRSGRCYRADQPSTPTNGLLAGWTTAGPDNGPINPQPEILSTLPIYQKNAASGAFDELTPVDAQNIANYIESQKPAVSSTYFAHHSAYGNYNGSPGTPWIMRKSQDYIVAEMIQNGFISQMCYYFKLVRQ